ncbi:phosphoglycerate dehydrogenase [candidate division KSB1 bacterium]|nr:phosphoglycerate dehydrogenase [candidate division KSB1 bacterium]NIR73445.1 phosphoglycerate dehydrogenase [candidate division KSB1 bacterium]NIS27060.1 phosphoglycerate dehydrogenase [candidate division KSB1 bacterium]NIT73904.1 phosphoglycerate dehydrogenase [candidate division KSB1 bacterium]NIU27805.1 phosphoglycerate dehydrogenase [candidate division KSB1 bacterium]
MSSFKILISENVAEICVSKLLEKNFEVAYRSDISADELLDIIRDFHGLIVRSATKVTSEVIQAGTKLKVIGRAGVGIDNIDLDTATRKGIAVFNAASANTLSAAEHTFALMLALARDIPKAHISIHNGEWNRSAFKGVELFGKTLGIVGLGKIGREVATRAQAFKMQTLGCDPLIETGDFERLGVEECDLHELFRRSDFMTVHVPLIAETKHLITEEHFAIAKSSLRIINTARGGVIDESALFRALESGRIAAAALDVFEEEPPVNNPLLELENVVTTPHLAASTNEAQEKVAAEIAESVANFLLEKRTDNIINAQILDRNTA